MDLDKAIAIKYMCDYQTIYMYIVANMKIKTVNNIMKNQNTMGQCKFQISKANLAENTRTIDGFDRILSLFLSAG